MIYKLLNIYIYILKRCNINYVIDYNVNKFDIILYNGNLHSLRISWKLSITDKQNKYLHINVIAL